MVLRCRGCGAAVAETNIQMTTGIGTCGYCGAISQFAAELGITPRARTQRHDDEAFQSRPAFPLPKGFSMEASPDRLHLTRSWFHPVFLFLAGFCLVWNALLVAWFAFATPIAMQASPLLGVVFTVFPLIHVAVGLGLAYYTIAGFVNQTVVDVDTDHVQVSHRPLPFPGAKTLSSREIQQLYSQVEVNLNRRMHPRAGFTYVVKARLKDGRQVDVMAGFTDPEEALFVEQQIEKTLKIIDAPVRHELPRL